MLFDWQKKIVDQNMDKKRFGIFLFIMYNKASCVVNPHPSPLYF